MIFHTSSYNGLFLYSRNHNTANSENNNIFYFIFSSISSLISKDFVTRRVLSKLVFLMEQKQHCLENVPFITKLNLFAGVVVQWLNFKQQINMSMILKQEARNVDRVLQQCILEGVIQKLYEIWSQVSNLRNPYHV